MPYHLTRTNGKQVVHYLSNFIHDCGAPEYLTFDGVYFQVLYINLFQDNLRRSEIHHHVSAPRRPNENPSEVDTRKIEKRWSQIMLKNKVPKRSWD